MAPCFASTGVRDLRCEHFSAGLWEKKVMKLVADF